MESYKCESREETNPKENGVGSEKATGWNTVESQECVEYQKKA